MESLKNILEQISKEYNYFEVSNSVDDEKFCGYGLKLKHKPIININQIQSLSINEFEWKTPRLCLELDPTQDLDLFDYYNSLCAKVNLKREKSGLCFQTIDFPTYESNENCIKIKWHNKDLIIIKCQHIVMLKNNEKCELQTLDFGELFKAKNIREMFINESVFYCVINPYLLGKFNNQQRDDLKVIYYALSNDYSCSAFPFCSLNLNNNDIKIGLWDNLRHAPCKRHVPQTNEQTLIYNLYINDSQKIVHNLYEHFEKCAHDNLSFNSVSLFNKYSHFIY